MTQVYTTSDTVSGNGTYGASYTLPTTGTVTGTYTWPPTTAATPTTTAPATRAATAEQTVVSKASPTVMTTASPAVTLGTTAPTLSDTADLEGGYYETGTHHLHAVPGHDPGLHHQRHGQRQRHLRRQLHAAHHRHGDRHLHLARPATAATPTTTAPATRAAPPSRRWSATANPTVMTTASPAHHAGHDGPDHQRHGDPGRRLLRDRHHHLHADQGTRRSTPPATRSAATAPTAPATRCRPPAR